MPLPQLSIFTAAPYSDPETSRDAAKAIEPHIQEREQSVLDALDHWGSQTQEQLVESTGLPGDTVRPRLVALRARGLVIRTDEKRRTASGRKAAVWRRA